MSYSKRLTNAQLAEARARIMAKLDTDDAVIKALEEKNKMTYQEKSKKVSEIIKDLSKEDTQAFIDGATQKEKANAVKNIIDALKRERDAEIKDREKKKVDRDAEKARNAPPIIRPDLSYAQKSAEFSNIQNFYKREKKQDAIDRKNADKPPKTVEKDVFKYVQKNNPENDIFSYRKILNRYPELSNTRSYIETPRRVRFSQPVAGSFFSFRYWAKGYDELPKFDRSPLIYVLGNDMDRFLGINFHWCRTHEEAFQYVKEIEEGNTNILFRDDCYHTYLKNSENLLSPLYYIAPEEIRVAIMLPLAQWYIR